MGLRMHWASFNDNNVWEVKELPGAATPAGLSGDMVVRVIYDIGDYTLYKLKKNSSVLPEVKDFLSKAIKELFDNSEENRILVCGGETDGE